MQKGTIIVAILILILAGMGYAYMGKAGGYSLTITVVGSGTTTPAAGIYDYNSSTSVSVSAQANSGFQFSYWLFNSVQNSSNPIVVVVDGTCTLVAVFNSISPSAWNRNSFGETLQIDAQGHISLNGNRIVAVGFHVKHGGGNPTSSVANLMLQRLSNDEIRFMALNFEGGESDAAVTADINFWMPLLTTYRMWVDIQVQHLKPEPPTLTVSAQLPRNQLVVNTISQNPTWAHMVFAYSFAWELDNWFTDAQVTTYMNQMTPQIKSLLQQSAIGDVPLLSKPMSPDNLAGKVPMGQAADLVGMDYYFQVTSSGSGTYSNAASFESRIPTYMSQCGKAGYAIWHTEWGMHNYNYNAELNANMFSQLLDEMNSGNTCGAVFVWLMWGSDVHYYAFNSAGSPTQWYLNICGLFRNQLSGLHLNANEVLNAGSIVNVNGIMNVGSIQMQ